MNDDRKRIFLVGCGRSGTTLLQAMLSVHNEIISFPESQFFSSLVDQYETRVMGEDVALENKLLYSLQAVLLAAGLSPRPKSGINSINRFIDKIEIDVDYVTMPLRRYLVSSQVSEMTGLMDKVAENAGKKVWLLKTPSNVSYIDVIQKYVPDAKFIHIVRPGKDVVASIYDAAMKYPDTVWRSHFYKDSLQRIANMWNQAITKTASYVGQPNHVVILYESLIDNPEHELSRLFEFIGIVDDPTCATRYAEQTRNIVSDNEKWKKGVSGEVRKVNKYDSVFNEEQKSLLREILLDLDALIRV